MDENVFLGINHIGVVVQDVDKWVDFLSRAFGAEEVFRTDLPERGQCSCIMAINGQNVFELMAPIGDGGVVGKYLETYGEGFHHISLKTNDLEADTQALTRCGVNVFGRSVVEGQLMAFTHPKTSLGLLYELAEEKNVP